MRKILTQLSWLFDLFSRSYLVFAASLVIFTFFAVYLAAYGEFSPKDGFDFLWQTIGFTFVLAAMMLSIGTHIDSRNKNISFEKAGYLCILSGTGMIFGFGLNMIGALGKAMWLGAIFEKFGLAFFVVAIFLLSIAITLMTYLAVQKLFSRTK